MGNESMKWRGVEMIYQEGAESAINIAEDYNSHPGRHLEYNVGSISITRPSGGGEQFARISVCDASSGVHVITVDVPIAAFADALMHRACACAFGISRDHLDGVGKVRENKIERIELPSGVSPGSANADEIMRPYEVDGWRGSRSDFVNHHRRRGGTVSVSFTRLVDYKEE